MKAPKRSPAPWTVEASTGRIRDDRGQLVTCAVMGDVATYIVHSANAHERLRRALKSIHDFLDTDICTAPWALRQKEIARQALADTA